MNDDAHPGPRRGKLSLVATPIGNLDDITLRALKVLKACDVILAEDTRHTLKLLRHFEIERPLRSLHAHSSEATLERLSEALAEGTHFALCTDAGTPLVSDPGIELAARVRDIADIEVLPGASAVTTALNLAALRCDVFRFVGFLPRAGKKRRLALAEIAAERGATVLFEAPSRLLDTLMDLGEVLQEGRLIAVCREMTKRHEEVVRGTPAEVHAHFAENVRGEISIVVEGTDLSAAELSPTTEAPTEADIDTFIAAELAEGKRPRAIAADVSTRFQLRKREAYQKVLALRPGGV